MKEFISYLVIYFHSKGFIEVKTVVDGSETNIFNYVYDKIGQLTEVKKNNSTIESYSYDSNGNRLNNNAQYDSQDRLISNSSTTFGYTERGTLLTRTENNQTTSYNYDLMGNLLSVTLPNSTDIEYITDARNRRIAKKVNGIVTQKFLYLNQLEPIAELDANDNIISLFIYGTRSNTPDYIVKNNVKYKVVTNQLGSVVKVVNVSSGEIIQSIEYDSFGNILSDTNPNFQPFTLAGGIYDNDTKLTRFGARDYDAREGRWTSKDPIKFDGGMNFYSYCNGDPVNRIDVNGLITSDAGNLPISEYDLPLLPDGLVNSVAGFGDYVSLGITNKIRDWMGTNDVVDKYSNEYIAGSIVGYVFFNTLVSKGIECLYTTGYEITITKNIRLAPFGNRTGHPYGKYPHYHRRKFDGNGKERQGQGIGRHRPFENKYDRKGKNLDTSPFDRF